MIQASCHCGGISLELTVAPREITECNCSICRRYGVLWAYYHPNQVRLIPPALSTNVYVWDDRTIEFHRCGNCGCVSHWTAVDPNANRMGVNARLLPPELIFGLRVRHLDGAITEQYID
jgi:hypothetical protein